MGNCKDCKFWESHTDQWYKSWNKSWNACEAVNWVNRSEKISDSSFAIYADASDDSGLDAGLKTGPMFGCIKFEQKK